MSDKSNIEWTDATWNPVRGCVKVSPGCANCYAETFAERFRGVHGHPYEQGFDLRLVPDKLDEPLHWRAGVKEPCPLCMGSGSKNDAIACGACGGRGWTMRPKRVFVNSMSDLFQDGVPDEYIDRVFAVMALCPQHTFQVLTKRAERMRSYMTADSCLTDRIDDAACQVAGACHANLDAPGRWPLPNVWLGTSFENQHFADERISLLLQTPAAVHFISAEPLLSSTDIGRYVGILDDGEVSLDGPFLDWVIVGGESGHGARPFDVAWARSIVKQCRDAGVACFVKQLGANPYELNDGPDSDFLDLHSKKGGDMAEWPEDLRVRQFPDLTTPRD